MNEMKADLVLADLIRDIAHAQEARRKRFSAIVRFVRQREALGPAKDIIEQVRRDEDFGSFLSITKTGPEIIGMMHFVRDLKMKGVLAQLARTAS